MQQVLQLSPRAKGRSPPSTTSLVLGSWPGLHMGPTFDGDLVLPSARVCEELHMDGHLPNWIIHAGSCSTRGREGVSARPWNEDLGQSCALALPGWRTQITCLLQAAQMHYIFRMFLPPPPAFQSSCVRWMWGEGQPQPSPCLSKA